MGTNASDPDVDWGSASEGVGSARASGKRTMLWVGLALGIAALLALTCVGGGLGLTVIGLGMVSSEIEDELRDNEVLQAEIGTLEAFEMDWRRSLKEEGDDVFVYRAKGSKRSGIVRVESSTTADDHERVVWAELELPSGEKRELVARPVPTEKTSDE